MFGLICLSVSVASEVKLISIGEGDAYWSAFGHTALLVNDEKVYGFGYFSFEDEDFFKSFIFGKMRYFLGVSDADSELSYAIADNRSYFIQPLALSSEKSSQVIRKLSILERPENRYYDYDYFLNNCSSIIRDILDESVGGQLKEIYNQPSGSNYFKQTFPAKNQAWMNLGIAIGYGLPSYQTRSQWELMVFPRYLMESLANTANPLTSKPDVLYQQKSTRGSAETGLNSHWAMLLIIVMFLMLYAFSNTRSMVCNGWLVLQSLIGMTLLFLWFFTAHSVAENNFNVLLFFPFAFVLLFNTKLLKPFLLINIFWLAIALYLGAWYLLMFFLFNLLIYKHKSIKDSLDLNI
ncbi:MAG: DUF4105 domain-containing protein [Proteobacteria bacterium]|nr:DUF4105 domain-containing protein [Pseudomonadota bacterium]